MDDFTFRFWSLLGCGQLDAQAWVYSQLITLYVHKDRIGVCLETDLPLCRYPWWRKWLYLWILNLCYLFILWHPWWKKWIYISVLTHLFKGYRSTYSLFGVILDIGNAYICGVNLPLHLMSSLIEEINIHICVSLPL